MVQYKICLVNPFTTPHASEAYHFYLALKRNKNVILVDFDEADYLFFINDARRCWEKPWYNAETFNHTIIDKIKNHRNYNKEIIIDYSDCRDINSSAHKNVRPHVYRYFKRSIVDRKTNQLINYKRNIIPISYAVRCDYLEYDKNFADDNIFKYDICCLFPKVQKRYEMKSMRNMIPYLVDKFDCSKYIGLVLFDEYDKRYSNNLSNYGVNFSMYLFIGGLAER